MTMVLRLNSIVSFPSAGRDVTHLRENAAKRTGNYSQEKGQVPSKGVTVRVGNSKLKISRSVIVLMKNRRFRTCHCSQERRARHRRNNLGASWGGSFMR